MYYLYVKTHIKTRLKYLGKTSNSNYHSYPGSGKYWLRHLKQHGHFYDTEILLATNSKKELIETGIFFSRLWNIVKSNEWANLKEECGDGGDTSHLINYTYLLGNKHGRGNSSKLKTLSDKSINASLINLKKASIEVLRDDVKIKRKNTFNLINHQKGSKNSQYGTMWITNGQENKKIKKDIDIMPEGWYKGRIRN